MVSECDATLTVPRNPLIFLILTKNPHLLIGIAQQPRFKSQAKITELLLLNPLAGYCQPVILRESARRGARPAADSFHKIEDNRLCLLS
jgi:hypothetical protein